MNKPDPQPLISLDIIQAVVNDLRNYQNENWTRYDISRLERIADDLDSLLVSMKLYDTNK